MADFERPESEEEAGRMSAATWIDAQDTSARPLFPDGKRWTVEEFLELPEDDQRVELLDGSLLMSPPAAGGHQLVVGILYRLLGPAVPLSWHVIFDAGLKIGRFNLLIPDLMVITRPDPQKVYKPADVALVAEVMSPGSIQMDRTTKPDMYAEAGIEWYMRIEQKGANAPRVFLYRREGDVYVEHARAHAGQTLHMTEPVDVSFDPVRLTHFHPRA